MHFATAAEHGAGDVGVSDALVRALTTGEAALESGELAAAVDAFSDAWRLVPTEVSLALALANVHALQGDLLARRAVLQRACTIGDWRLATVAHTLGGALLEAGAPVEAARCFSHVVERHPDDPAALAALASAHRASGHAAAAWPLAQRAIALAPNNAAHLLTAAQVRHDLGDLPGALRWLAAADRVRPHHGPTQVQRAYTSLLHAPTAEGWAAFEYRPLPVPATAAQPWYGEPLNDRSVLVTAEQGVGDQFQFLRFVARLRERGAGRIVVECHEHAVSLLAANGYEAVPRGSAVETDVHVPLMSLPHRLDTDTNVDGDRVPYLRATGSAPIPLPARVAGQPRIGLVWAGNPAFSGRYTRDLSPQWLAALTGEINVSWISLQQGTLARALPSDVAPLPPLTSWAQSATVLQSLDGLLTTDTGIAHLAGSMGIATWVMLQHVPDWRWGLTGHTTPWYPTLELVRQSTPGDWDGVVRAARASLQRRFSDSGDSAAR